MAEIKSIEIDTIREIIPVKEALRAFFAAESARVFAESAISEIERTRLASASLPAIYPLPNSVIWYSEKTGRIEVPERSYSII